MTEHLTRKRALNILKRWNTEMTVSALSAAERLSDRFNPNGRYIRAHGKLSDPRRAGYAIIDTVMNLRLLFWAGRFTGAKSYYDIGRDTAETIAREYIRGDGSWYQDVWFDPETGDVVKKDTHQETGLSSGEILYLQAA